MYSDNQMVAIVDLTGEASLQHFIVAAVGYVDVDDVRLLRLWEAMRVSLFDDSHVAKCFVGMVSTDGPVVGWALLRYL